MSLKNSSFKKIVALVLCLFVFLVVTYSNKNSNQKFDQVTIKLSSKKYEPTKYIVYECVEGALCGGLGDRLKGIYSAYAWSLISKRKFLISYSKPCLLTNMLLPNRINWHENIVELVRNKKVENLHHVDHAHMKDVCKNNKLDEFERNQTDVITIRNNLDWLLSMSQNVNIKERLIELGYEPDKFTMPYVFKKWYDDLFKLHPRLEQKYFEFLKKAKPNAQTKLICAQIRIGGKREHVDYDDTFMSKNNTYFYWKFIREHIEKSNNNFMIFLTTDTRSVQEEAVRLFGEKLIMHEGINAHLDREHNLKNDCSKLDKIYLDFHSLQNCDAAIISESGFGKLGTWNRLEPSKNLAMFNKQQKLIVYNDTKELFIF